MLQSSRDFAVFSFSLVFFARQKELAGVANEVAGVPNFSAEEGVARSDGVVLVIGSIFFDQHHPSRVILSFVDNPNSPSNLK